MSLSEFQPFVDHVIKHVLKPGGMFISLEAVPHVQKCNLSGILAIQKEWTECKDKSQLPYRVVLDDDSLLHDRFTDDKMKLFVVQRIK